MKATHKDGNVLLAHISIKFSYTAFHLEQIIIYLLATEEKKITKKRIREWLDYGFHSGGRDNISQWNHPDDVEKYESNAKEISQKLFPTFYKKD